MGLCGSYDVVCMSVSWLLEPLSHQSTDGSVVPTKQLHERATGSTESLHSWLMAQKFQQRVTSWFCYTSCCNRSINHVSWCPIIGCPSIYRSTHLWLCWCRSLANNASDMVTPTCHPVPKTTLRYEYGYDTACLPIFASQLRTPTTWSWSWRCHTPFLMT